MSTSLMAYRRGGYGSYPMTKTSSSSGSYSLSGRSYPSSGSYSLSGRSYPSSGSYSLSGRSYPSSGSYPLSGKSYPSSGSYPLSGSYPSSGGSYPSLESSDNNENENDFAFNEVYNDPFKKAIDTNDEYSETDYPFKYVEHPFTPILNVEPVIPKVIWCFWNDNNLPPLVKYCLDTWKRTMGPHGFEIRLCNIEQARNVMQMPGDNGQYLNYVLDTLLAQKRYAHFSDIFRYTVLSKYGGFYMDATTIIRHPRPFLNMYKKMVENPNYEIGLYTESFQSRIFPFIWNAILICRARSPMMIEWLQEAINALSKNCATYSKSLHRRGYDAAQELFQFKDDCYLITIAAFQKVMQRRSPSGHNLDKFILFEFADKGDGWWTLFYESQFNGDKFVRLLTDKSKYYDYPAIKLTRDQRIWMEERGITVARLYALDRQMRLRKWF